MLEEIRRMVIDSDLSPHDLRIMLDIIKAVTESNQQD